MTNNELTPGQIEYMEKMERQAKDINKDHGNDIDKWAERLHAVLTVSKESTHFYGTFQDTAYTTMEIIRVPKQMRSYVYEKYKELFWEDK